MNDPKPEKENTEETLAQRSARLEAEAAALYAVPKSELMPDTGKSAELEQKIKTLEAELEKTKDQMLRALADAENSRKRAMKEREDASKFAISNFAKDLITVADNFRRAIDSIPAEAAAADARVKSLLDGIEATERTMLKTFEQHGIRKIVPENEPFNPNYHDVMFEAPGTGKPAGTVIQVIEAGYVLNDRLLRPARVAVAKDEGQGGGEPGSRIDTQA